MGAVFSSAEVIDAKREEKASRQARRYESLAARQRDAGDTVRAGRIEAQAVTMAEKARAIRRRRVIRLKQNSVDAEARFDGAAWRKSRDEAKHLQETPSATVARILARRDAKETKAEASQNFVDEYIEKTSEKVGEELASAPAPERSNDLLASWGLKSGVKEEGAPEAGEGDGSPDPLEDEAAFKRTLSVEQLEVWSDLPTSVQTAFASRDFEVLGEVFDALDEAVAEEVYNRCINVGMWDPDNA